MSRAAKHFGLLLGLAATIGFVVYARDALQGQDLSRYASARSLLAISIAAICYSMIFPVSAWAWRLLLADLNVHRPWRELTEILAITQLAKYVPGNIGVHLGRTAMAISKGIGSGPVVLSMLAETALAIAAALCIGVLGALLSKPGLGAVQGDIRGSITVAALLAAGGILAFLLLKRRLMSLAQQITQRRGWTMPSRLAPRLSTALRAFVGYCANYLVIGLGIWGMCLFLLPARAHDIGLLSASFALAWIAGFFAPGAPAGFGVREAIMLGILGFSYAQADALVIVIALRLATMLGDTLCFIAGYVLLRLSLRQQATPKNSD